MNTTILITGGAGFIGSVIAYKALQRGYHCIILDRAPTLPVILRDHPLVTFICDDYASTTALDAIVTKYTLHAIIHCAASIEVGESVINPLLYYENNVSKTIKLLTHMHEHGVKNIIFSSSCAVYGVPQWVPLTEDHPRLPISPYGWTKYMIEQILEDACRAYGMSAIALRYFNAAGAVPEVGLGERHEPETHLIPRILSAVTNNQAITIFGTDYPTNDGTCVRDYIHVLDLAEMHLKALEYVNNAGFQAFNIGSGTGTSVLQLISAIETQAQKSVKINPQSRRQGDPPVLLANIVKAQNCLNFKPYFDLRDILSSMIQYYSL